MLSPDCFPLPVICCLRKSCIWRLKYRETLLIQSSGQSLGQQSLTLLSAVSPIHSVTEDTHLCKDLVHAEWLQKGWTLACFCYSRVQCLTWRQSFLSHIQNFVTVLTRAVKLHRQHISLTENASSSPHPLANTQIALKSNIAPNSNKTTGQTISFCDNSGL